MREPSTPEGSAPRPLSEERRRAEVTSGLPKRYDPACFEPKWQSFWEEKQLFRAPELDGAGPHWTIVFPPPNVTGVLTFGHSLQGTTEDLLCRWQRMKGLPTLFLPGLDHAGVATQMAVRKDLEKKGVNVGTLSREELHARIEEWRHEKERYIRRQLTAHGLSMDWSRYVYTMEPRYSEAVRTAFLTLYREGLVYRAERMINWDPKLRTALSDLEVIPTETQGKLWYIRYPDTDPAKAAKGEGFVVATTRPETMFGDVAVAVNPKDERHGPWVGRKVLLPLTDRGVPIITDEAIDPTFGTGALKVTPSHDRVDHEIALRHPELPSKRDTIDDRGRLEGEFVPERFRGMERFAARKAIVEELRGQGLLVKEELHVHNVGHSERSEVPIEPRLSTQWFVDTSKMGLRALEAVRKGEVRIIPERWLKTYYNFMENLEPWCISRQVVWGHEIPVWYCDACGAYDAFEVPPKACPKCGSEALHQDPDVLDTWFSSWLWPFATLGWPKRTGDLARYYPVSVLGTGSDIVFFWVARMIMGGLQFLDTPPFPYVYLTGILTDRQGRKLSKHLGNSPDPIEIIQQWGADAFRFALLFPLPVEDGGAWDPQKMMEGSRNFLTKVWNLTRLVEPATSSLADSSPPHLEEAPLMDRWIASRWSQTAQEVEDRLSRFDLTGAAGVLHQFLWHELADWWAEAAKERLSGRAGKGPQEQAARTGAAVLERTLRLLHPFVPHISEELWTHLPHTGESLAVAAWPSAAELPSDVGAEATVSAWMEIARGLRTLKADAHLSPSARPVAFARPRTAAAAALLQVPEVAAVTCAVAGAASFHFLAGDAPPEGARALVTPSAEVFLVPPAGAAGSSGESSALRKERDLVSDLLSKTRARLADATFRGKAPPKVVQEVEAKEKELSERLRLLEEHLRAPETEPSA
ncbi:MAG: valine--tRNA ligase [Euryarchaeota archaeon]|nr:valine--tRNA ligase [Euryarchaeota archaeon]